MFGSDETKDHNAAALKRVENWRGLLLDGSVRCVGSDSALVKETWALTLSIFTVGQNSGCSLVNVVRSKF